MNNTIDEKQKNTQEINRTESKNKNLTTVLLSLTLLSSLATLTTQVFTLPSCSDSYVIEEDTIPKKILEEKTKEFSKLFNTEFIVDEDGFLESIISNDVGSIQLYLSLDTDGSIDSFDMYTLNLNNNEELNKKAEEIFKSALSLEADKDRDSLLKGLSEITAKFKSEAFLKSEEYRHGLEAQRFSEELYFKNNSKALYFSTTNPTNPGTYFEINVY